MAKSLNDKQFDALQPSDADPNQFAMVVMNPDGSSIGTGSTTGNVADDAVDSGNPIKVGGIAASPTSLPTAVAAGDRKNLVLSLQGEILAYLTALLEGEDQTNHLMGMLPKIIASSTYSPSLFSDYGANVGLNVKATPGNVVAVACYNANAALRHLQLHDTTSVPAPGVVPFMNFAIPGTSQLVVGTEFFTQAGKYFTNGITWTFSTTRNTYTAAVAGDQTTLIHYK